MVKIGPHIVVLYNNIVEIDPNIVVPLYMVKVGPYTVVPLYIVKIGLYTVVPWLHGQNKSI